MKQVVAFLLLFSICSGQLNVITFFVDSIKKTIVQKNDCDNEEKAPEKGKEKIEEDENFFQFNNIRSLNKLLVIQGKQYYHSSQLLYSNPFKKKDIKPPQLS